MRLLFVSHQNPWPLELEYALVLIVLAYCMLAGNSTYRVVHYEQYGVSLYALLVVARASTG